MGYLMVGSIRIYWVGAQAAYYGTGLKEAIGGMEWEAFLRHFSWYAPRWQHLFPVQTNQYVQSLTLSSMAQENANKIKTTIKRYNMNEYSTSSNQILLLTIKFCYREAFVATPCRSHWSLRESLSAYVMLHAYGNHCQHVHENVIKQK